MRVLDSMVDRLERFDAALEWDDEDDLSTVSSGPPSRALGAPCGPDAELRR